MFSIMAMDKTFLIAFGIIIGIYILYKFLFGKSQLDEEFEQTYNKVLTSDEYKVKGQYDK